MLPPGEPMLAKSVPTIPPGLVYEPKWDGFRTVVHRDGESLELGSRSSKPLTRYFPEVVAALAEQLPEQITLDGEVILPTGGQLDFEALLQRIHPAASRVKMLAGTTPCWFVAFDLLGVGGEDLTGLPYVERRGQLLGLGLRAPLFVTPNTSDEEEAQGWFSRFEGAGLDGVMAKDPTGTYQPGKRGWFKVKHERTADCVVHGYRVHTSGPDAVGSLLLGLWRDGNLAGVGVCGAFTMARRRELMTMLKPEAIPFEEHPWAQHVEGAVARTEGGTEPGDAAKAKGAGSRWNAGKDLSFVPLDGHRVVEVKYDHLEGQRFRHTTQFVRWREDREPASCTFDQLDQPVDFDVRDVLNG